MPLVIRSARADELPHAEELVVRSINDLTVRHGFGSVASVRSAEFQEFCLQDDPRGVWLAEDDDGIAGFALSWVCGPMWFLAELFVAPGRQGQGIGNELLHRSLQFASQTGATEKSLVTFAFNVVSQGLYVRHGMLPRAPIHLCSADREALARRMKASQLRTVPIGSTAADVESLRRIDMAGLGVSRDKHHRFLLDSPSMAGVFLEEAGERVGYAYVAETGHVGPLAVVDARVLPAAFRAALAIAAAGDARQVSAFIPGPSGALETAADLDMRFTLPMVLMSSSRDALTNYLPRNPGFM